MCGGYWAVRVFGEQFYIHKVIYEMHHGDVDCEVDHKDVNHLNNLVGNLRPATQKDNVRNIKIPRHNTSGVKGVCWCKKNSRWEAKLGIDGKRVHIGYFDTLEEAATAYKEASEYVYGEFANQG